MIPETRYARTADGFSIAYQILGDSGLDLVYLAGFASNLEYQWENPLYARFLRRLASFSRLIMIDRRGTGLSDRVSPKEIPPIEGLMDDLGAVLDEVGSQRSALTGFADGADLCALFAATHPDRTAALVLYGASAITRHADDTPWGWTEEEWESYLEELARGWGTEEYVQQTLRWAAPSVAADTSNGGSAPFCEWRLAPPPPRRRHRNDLPRHRSPADSANNHSSHFSGSSNRGRGRIDRGGTIYR